MRKTLWALSAAALFVMPAAAQPPWPNTKDPWQDPPGILPPVNGGFNPHGPPRPGIPGIPGGRRVPNARDIVKDAMRPAFPGGNLRGDPFPGFPHVPTAADIVNEDGRSPSFPGTRSSRDPSSFLPGAPGIRVPPGIHNDPSNGIPGVTRQGGYQPWKPAAFPQIPPEALRVEVPKFEMPYPYSKTTSGDSPRRDGPSRVPSWLRWEWAVGVFALSFAAGLLRGYLRGKQAG
jgi:hypothetical protein